MMDTNIDYERIGKLTIEVELAFIRYNETDGEVEREQWLSASIALDHAVDEEMDKIWDGKSWKVHLHASPTVT